MGIAESLHYLAEIDAREGHLDRAMLSFAQSLAIRRKLSDRLSMAESLESIGILQIDLKDCRKATRILAAAAALRIEIESQRRLPVGPAWRRQRHAHGKRLAHRCSGPNGSKEAA